MKLTKALVKKGIGYISFVVCVAVMGKDFVLGLISAMPNS